MLYKLKLNEGIHMWSSTKESLEKGGEGAGLLKKYLHPYVRVYQVLNSLQSYYFS